MSILMIYGIFFAGMCLGMSGLALVWWYYQNRQTSRMLDEVTHEIQVMKQQVEDRDVSDDI